jgi:hypothetical protein
MSANDTFNINRFLLLFKQHYIHGNKIMLYSVIAFCGAAFLVLSLVQLENETPLPLDTEVFITVLASLVSVFGIIFVGHAFPAFRSKETAASYLTLPASIFEKYLFELIYRVGATLIVLPVLFWITFHFHGYFFQLFTDLTFEPVNISEINKYLSIEIDEDSWILLMVTSMSLLAITIPFAGAAHFAKQPMVKTLFTVGILVLFFVLLIYFVFVELALENYHPNESMFLIPTNESGAFKFLSTVFVATNVFMLVITYLKLKEKEV